MNFSTSTARIPPPRQSKALRRDLSPLGRGAWPVVVLAFGLLSSSTIAARADADHAAIAKASLEQYIRPGYTQFAESADALK